MTNPEMIDAAEANIRADYRAGKITKEQFQKEMLIVTRSRQQELADPSPEPNVEGRGDRLRAAANDVIASASDSYKKRNGHLASFEDDTGEKAWIVPFDAFEELRAALAATTEGSADGN